MTRTLEQRKELAKKLLTHYFDLCYREATGKSLEWDCLSEIGCIIDAIFDEIEDINDCLNQRGEE